MSHLDQKKADAFSENMLNILNESMLSLMIGIGYQTGLFECMSGMSPSTSKIIASESGLHERYVREWLAAMVTGKIIDYDADKNTYSLPSEHASVLTHSAGQNNMARLAMVIPYLSSVQKDVIRSFHQGGGVSYSAYSDFMALWADINAERFNATINQGILPLMPDVVEKMHCGIEVLDLGCGNGHILNLMAEKFPESHFTGYDFSEDSIYTARKTAKSLGLTNVTLEVTDIMNFNEQGKYGLITAFDVIHDIAQPAGILQSIADSLAEDGTFLMVDLAASSELKDNVNHPFGTWLYTTSCMHCMTVSLGLNGIGLGAMWGKQKALEMLDEAGFKNVEIKSIPEDAFNNYYLARKNK